MRGGKQVDEELIAKIRAFGDELNAKEKLLVAAKVNVLPVSKSSPG